MEALATDPFQPCRNFFPQAGQRWSRAPYLSQIIGPNVAKNQLRDRSTYAAQRELTAGKQPEDVPYRAHAQAVVEQPPDGTECHWQVKMDSQPESGNQLGLDRPVELENLLDRKALVGGEALATSHTLQEVELDR